MKINPKFKRLKGGVYALTPDKKYYLFSDIPVVRTPMDKIPKARDRRRLFQDRAFIEKGLISLSKSYGLPPPPNKDGIPERIILGLDAPLHVNEAKNNMVTAVLIHPSEYVTYSFNSVTLNKYASRVYGTLQVGVFKITRTWPERIVHSSSGSNLIKLPETTDSYIAILPISPRHFYTDNTPVKRARRGFVFDPAGKEIRLRNAVKINGNWYLQGEGAVEIDGKWVVNDPAKVAIDMTTGKYNWVSQMKRIVWKADIHGNFEYGLMSLPKGISEDMLPLVMDGTGQSNNKKLGGPTAEALKKNGFVEDEGISIFVPEPFYKTWVKSDVREAFYKHFYVFSYVANKLVNTIKGDVALDRKIKLHNLKFGTESLTDYLTENKGYTFGVELETTRGSLGGHVAKDLNVKCVRDGSIAGGEYVTGVLTGDSGFNILKRLCKELSARTKVDQTCGVHVHIGNASFTKEFSILLYLLCNMLENEIFSMHPNSRHGNNYCRPLRYENWLQGTLLQDLISSVNNKEAYKSIVLAIYNELYKHLSGGKELSHVLNRTTPHPQGHYAGGVGSGSARYEWLNIITANFKQHQYLMETVLTNKIKPRDIEMVLGDISGTNCFNVRINGNSSQESAPTFTLNTENEPISPPTRPPRPPGMSQERYNQLYGKIKPVDKADLHKYFTVEFRLHGGTTDYYKIRNWILICMGIVSFAESKVSILLEALKNRKILSLNDILFSVYSENLARKLMVYIDKRKAHFKENPDNFEHQYQINSDIDFTNSLFKTAKELKQ